MGLKGQVCLLQAAPLPVDRWAPPQLVAHTRLSTCLSPITNDNQTADLSPCTQRDYLSPSLSPRPTF